MVGSGASGVHFALGALRKGRQVTMLDVGHASVMPVRSEDSLAGLKQNLANPAEYFLGKDYESLILPQEDASEYYGFPPNKSYVFQSSPEFRYRASGFSPLVSFGAGGLAEAWTGGCYPFGEEELSPFPFPYREMLDAYGEVARRIGVTGERDDLAQFFPWHEGLQKPLRLDRHSERLLEQYSRKRAHLNGKMRCFLGRARSAVLSQDLAGRKACSYSGRCLWGCPTGAFYTPSITLRECQSYPGFRYVSGVYADHFRFSEGGEVRSLLLKRASDGVTEQVDTSTLVLAAGTLSTANIFLRSFYKDSGTAPMLRGLMDNRQVLMPFLNWRLIGQTFESSSYQYHQLAIGAAGEDPRGYVHGLITTLKTAMIHPITQSLPFDMRTNTFLLRNFHAALGLVNINFADSRREENYVALDTEGAQPRLAIHYQPEAGEPERLSRTVGLFRRLLLKLGCVAPPPMTHLRPMGASVHYAGTIPMVREARPLACSPEGRSYDFSNLYFADGTGFPFLPAKNLTFTLMANAARIAEKAF